MSFTDNFSALHLKNAIHFLRQLKIVGHQDEGSFFFSVDTEQKVNNLLRIFIVAKPFFCMAVERKL